MGPAQVVLARVFVCRVRRGGRRALPRKLPRATLLHTWHMHILRVAAPARAPTPVPIATGSAAPATAGGATTSGCGARTATAAVRRTLTGGNVCTHTPTATGPTITGTSTPSTSTSTTTTTRPVWLSSRRCEGLRRRRAVPCAAAPSLHVPSAGVCRVDLVQRHDHVAAAPNADERGGGIGCDRCSGGRPATTTPGHAPAPAHTTPTSATTTTITITTTTS